MARKLTVLAVVLVVGGAFTGWAMTASAKPSAPQAGGVTYHDHTVSSHNVDAAPSGFSAGDQFVFHDVLSQNGANKGTVNGICEVTQTRPFADACFGMAKIGDSQLNFQLGGGDNGNKPFRAGITGGTGQYQTARGYILIKPINNNNSTVTIYVMP